MLLNRRLSLVLPCFNEAQGLPALVTRVMQCANSRNLTPAEFQLVLVNNGSTDNSASVLGSLTAGDTLPFLKIVSVERNQGYGYGILQGLKACETGALAWSHADGQCDPDDVFRAWEILKASDQPMLVKGRRRGRPWGDVIFSRCFELAVLLLLRRRIYEVNAQPKVFDGQLLQLLNSAPKDLNFDLYVLLRAADAGFQVRELPVFFGKRKFGQSKWAFGIRSRIRTIAGVLRYLRAFSTERKLHG